jgi:outer membrane lipoprotein SlyB
MNNVNYTQTTTHVPVNQGGHKHETLKGALGGGAVASVVPGIGTIAGAVVGGVVGHHKKNEHISEGTHKFN